MGAKEFKVDIGRTPVVAVMGHVDHGKTSLLDAIRGTSVQAGEAGGITQNTRAHEVEYKNHKITFIDTPGHEAFSEMRSRGAKLTDIVLLVVAIDDGIQPQTKESIKFAKESGTPIVVAVNKVDVPGFTTEKIKSQLSQNDVLVEEYGGDVQLFEVSAKTKQGIDNLLEGILLQAEMMQIDKKTPEIGKAGGVVLESKLDKNLGPVALILLKSGSIKKGDYITDGESVSAIRAIMDEFNNRAEEAFESQPVWIVGIENVMKTGKFVYFEEDEKSTNAIRDQVNVVEEKAIEEMKPEEQEEDAMSLLASLLAHEQVEEDIKKFNVVVKSDSQGTLEAITSELEKLSDEEVKINILSSGTGDISRSDVLTAKNGHGIVLGFQVIVPTDLVQIIKQEKVLVRTYSIIYDLIEEVADAMEGMLEPLESEEEVAVARVKKVFVLSDKSIVAGSLVESGKVIKGYRVKVMRGDEEIGRGKITQIKQNKNEVKEMQKGTECGIMIDPPVQVEEGDAIVLYKLVSN